VLYSISTPLGWIGFVLTLWCIFFFRDPNRTVPVGDNLIVSPADGIVQSIVTVKAPRELDMQDETMTRVSIFLNVFDVHVNRVPTNGVIDKMVYHHGKFLNASLDKASDDNERQSVKMTTTFGGHKLAFVQIAGLIARRIVCDLKEGQNVRIGDRYGIIRFGSRVDLYLPSEIAPQILVGQRMIGGETIIADLDSKQQKLIGEMK
jgi:phosphatidylserine decarboxylase